MEVKNNQNSRTKSYCKEKLKGTITWVSCNITSDYYDIDLTVFGASRGDEDEVVFPAIEDLITDIKILRHGV